ncbi:ABC transporter substrate-binding protein [Saccharopolyspora sp. K220]|uniref:ABC transporter substrate-binding protein n=1 Tax=Saccharopolyspora soli TaxID=2926618 RepID=UPI001F56F936|nr:ABC transporter substrate-binding protein [Saccharopolyspora soli]MCI2423239.1 ABC transporter substrate-binding protein [Saccharopolyspora soli]
MSRSRGGWTRAVLVAMVFGILGGMLAACGQSREPAPDSTSGSSTPTSAFPVHVEHRFGTTTVTEQPKRVAVIGTSTDDLDAMLALGVTPVAFFTKDQATPDGQYPWLSGLLDPAKTQVISAAGGVDVEQVVQVRPDLILATGDFGLDQEYATLSKAAPTIGYQTEWGAQTWQQHVRVVGSVLGRSGEAERLIAGTEAKVAEIARGYPGLAGKTFSMSMASAPGQVFTLISPQDFAVKQMTELGLRLAPSLVGTEQVNGSPTGSLGPEQLDRLNADLVVVAFGSPQARQAFEGNPLVRNMPVLGTGAYLVADVQLISQLRYPSVLGIPWALDKLRPGLAAAAGDGR